MTAIPNRKYSVEEYLELEEKAEFKSEYYKGEIFAMAGASSNHNRICRNLTAILHYGLKNKICEVFVNEMKVYVEQNTLFTYPDVSVVCSKNKDNIEKNGIVTNPKLIIEVLSKSTENYDRTDKFRLYRDIESLEEYILVSQEKKKIEIFRKNLQNRWEIIDLEDNNNIVKFESIDCELDINDIYENVEFE